MPQAGVGVDMLEVARLERVMGRRPNFASQVFTDDERAFCDGSDRPARYFAECWVARGAVRRALGIGPDAGVGPRDIHVVREAGSAPRVVLERRADELAREQGVREIALSLSCTGGVVVANAVALTDATRPQVEHREDPGARLRATFKRARTVLDELDHLQEAKKV